MGKRSPREGATTRGEAALSCRMGPQRKQMRRIDRPGHVRFLTFSCRHRLPLLGTPPLRDAFSRHLDDARRSTAMRLLAWVVMPEHVHLLVQPSKDDGSVRPFLYSLKRRVAREVIGRWKDLDAPVLGRIRDRDGRLRFWQPGGGYDRNIVSHEELLEKRDYMHANPIRRGLAASPLDWRWSSAAWYAGRSDALLDMDPLNGCTAAPQSGVRWHPSSEA